MFAGIEWKLRVGKDGLKSRDLVLSYEEIAKMANAESNALFLEKGFRRVIEAVTKYTAEMQEKMIPQRIAGKYDRSECCATGRIIVGGVILLLSWSVSSGACRAIPIRAGLSVFALWLAVGAFSYPRKVVFVDLSSGGSLKSPSRSVILLFFNYIEVTIHFVSVYLLSSSIGYWGC